MNTSLSEQQKREIYEMYCDPNVSIKEIKDAYNVSQSTVCRVAQLMGAPARRPQNGHRKPRKSAKICPHCKHAIEVKGAKFCYICGSDVRDPKELLVERIVNIRPKLKFVPDVCRDELSKLLIDIQTELSKES